ncbi:hypothetical protein [uncultured Marinobacter sp.]|uniref:hypothetical protein n=1 Tax=uncultured Marinobacter sp. TaxID=187379 RepID=UPI000C58B5FE|nr:hypothetical protein [Halomonas sp.]|tara:strand:+ start:39651 stop:39896 length:246 start_codon:yes stop_codon:yes gene_type:complete
MDNEEHREWERIAFVAGRDGVSAAQTFAGQGIGQYEAAIREADSGGNQYGAAYRESLLASIRVYRQYLEQKESPRKSPGAQ